MTDMPQNGASNDLSPQKRTCPAWLSALLTGLGFFAVFICAQAVAALCCLTAAFVSLLRAGGTVDMQALLARYASLVDGHGAALSVAVDLVVLVALYLFFRKREGGLYAEAGFVRIGRGRGIPYLLLLGASLNVFLSRAMALLPEALLASYNEASAAVLAAADPITFMALLLLGPVVEEILFRGLVYGRFRRGMPAWAAALLASALFGAMHGHWIWAAYAFLLGMLFCFVYERFRSLYAPLLLHMAFNYANLFGALSLSLPAVAVLLISGALSALLTCYVLRFCGAAQATDNDSTLRR